MTGTTNERFIPIWLWIIILIEISVPTFFGIATIIDPSLWGADSLGALGQLYVTRNLAMVFAIALAAILRSRVALFVAILARYLTDFTDITAAFLRGPDAETQQTLIVFAVLLLILPVFGLIWLFKRRAGTG